MATSGAEAQRIRLQVLANNLANINTSGYKEDRTVFRVPDTNAESAAAGGDAPSATVVLGTGVIPMTSHTDFSHGPLQQTGNPLDLAVEGDGFFSIQTEQGVRYTRNGAFTISPEGLLATPDGDAVLGEGGEISIDGTEVRFDGEGNVIVDGRTIDRLRLVTIDEPGALRKIGQTLFELDEARGAAEPLTPGGVRQGVLEGSNVNAVKVMTELIEVQRGYESYQKMIQTMGDMASRVISGVGITE
jgi:flagellar basal-body rod protein FlgG